MTVPLAAVGVGIALVLLTGLVLCVLRWRGVREGLDWEAVAPGGGGPKPFYGKPGVAAVPLDIPIPTNRPIVGEGETYIDYSGTDWRSLCPSPPGTRCGTYADCGPAELCIDQAGWFAPSGIQSGSQVCVCSIQNACMTGENIC